MKKFNINKDNELKKAGEHFSKLHHSQHKAVSESKGRINNLKGFRNKALTPPVLCGWAYIAGLLQSHSSRLENHYKLPQTNKKIPDPLNAKGMSNYKHESDDKTYRGLGTRTTAKERQRLAQLFLAKSIENDVVIDKAFINQAVSQVVGLIALSKGYAK